MESKGEVLEDISRLLGLTGYELGVGSSIPRQFIGEVASMLRVSDVGTGVEVARKIVESSGMTWPEDGDSAGTPSGGGGTITLSGLMVLREAVIAQIESEEGVDLGATSLSLESGLDRWTYFIGQTVTRSILSDRFGIAKQGELLISPFTNDVFMFLDVADARIVKYDVASSSSRVVVSFSESDFEDWFGALESLRVLSTNPRRHRSLRLFEGLTSAVEYLGEFEVVSVETYQDDLEVSDLGHQVQIVLQSVDKWGPLNMRPRSSESLVSDFIFLEAYSDVDLSAYPTDDIDPFGVDPLQIEAGRREHHRIQNEVAGWLRQSGFAPLRPRSSGNQFDLAWYVGSQLFVAEIKSCSPDNLVKQFRLGLGQVLDYAEEFNAQPVLILGSRPITDRLVAVAARVQVTLLWPELLAGTDPRTL